MSPSHEFPRTTSCVPFSSRVRGPSGAGLRARLPPSSFRRALRAHDTLFIPSTSFTQPTTVSAGLRQLLWYLIAGTRGDRKSTRLNSSHLVISYAVFCLKKKKIPSRTVLL